MTGMLDYLAQLTGQTPQQIRLSMLGQGLTNVGAGLLSGKNWSEGLSRGLLGFQQAQQNTLEDAMRQATFGFNLDKMKADREQAAAKKKAIEDYIISQPAEQQLKLRAAAESGALDSIIANQMKPFTPNIETIARGTQQEQGYYDQSGKWVKVGEGPRFAPQQPPQPSEFDRLARAAGLAPGSPEYRAAAKAKLGGGGEWQTGKGEGGVEFKYNISTGETNLAKPTGGFYRLDELGGQPQGVSPQAGRAAVDLTRYGTKKEQATVSEGGVSSEQFQAEEKIRDDFNQLPEVKSYKLVLPVIQSAYDTLGRDNRASDINLIYALGKIMDPTSVVREGEMVLVQNAASPANQLKGYIDYLTGGGKFTPELRQQLITELQSRTDALQSQYQQTYQRYGDIAKSYGLDVNRTIGKATTQLGGKGSAGVPSDLPPGTVSAGKTKDGKNAWRLPDGSLVSE